MLSEDDSVLFANFSSQHRRYLSVFLFFPSLIRASFGGFLITLLPQRLPIIFFLQLIFIFFTHFSLSMFHLSVHHCAISDVLRFHLVSFPPSSWYLFPSLSFLMFHTPNISITSSLSSSPSLLLSSFSLTHPAL